MKLQLIAVGKLRTPYYEAGVHDYLTRIDRMIPIEHLEVPVGTNEDSNGKGESALVKEGEKLLRVLKPGTKVVTLEVTGKQISSEELSQWFQDEMVASTERIAFLIGGAWGLDSRVSSVSSLRLSLSRMTLPHELARLMLAEQIYRALTIWKGHPYHK